MRKNIIDIIKILGVGYYEIVVDIDLGFFYINTIEYILLEDKLLLHYFNEYDEDIELDFDEIDFKYKKFIWNLLYVYLYN